MLGSEAAVIVKTAFAEIVHSSALGCCFTTETTAVISASWRHWVVR